MLIDCQIKTNTVQVLLAELSERLSKALKDKAEIRTALSTLLNREK